MKKIKLLYDVARTMKNMTEIDGVVTVDVQKDQETVFSLRNKFEKDGAGKVKAKVSTKMNMNGENLTRESTTEFNVAAGCHHGSCGIWKSLHGHHAAGGHRGIKGVFHKISFILGILSSMTVEEQANGVAIISLNVSDVPDEIRAMVGEKLRQKHSHHAKFACLSDCTNVEILNGLVTVSVNEKHVIDKLTVNLDGRTEEPESKVHTLAAVGEIQFAW